MSKEKAIEVLQLMLDCAHEREDQEQIEALEMVIEAMKK